MVTHAQHPHAHAYQLLVSSELQQIQACRELRERVFAHELQWVPRSADGQERDAFDSGSVHVAVIHQWQVAGYLRITPYGKPWMLNECFSFLLEAGARSEMGQDSLEVSRLAVERKHRGRTLHDHYSVFDQLITGIIDYSLRTHCRYWFVVVAEPIYRLLLKKGLPCARLGPIVQMPDGVQTLAVRIDMQAFMYSAPSFFSAATGLQVQASPREIMVV